MDLQGEETEITSSIFDIHICGACSSRFHDVEKFLEHKRQCQVLVELLAGVRPKRQLVRSSVRTSLAYQQTDGENQQPRAPCSAFGGMCRSSQLHIETCGSQGETSARAGKQREDLGQLQQHSVSLDSQMETAGEHSHQPICLDETSFQDISSQEKVSGGEVGDNTESEEQAGSYLYGDENGSLHSQTQTLTGVSQDLIGLSSFSEISSGSVQASASAFGMSTTMQSGQRLDAGRPFLFSSTQAVSEQPLQRAGSGRPRHARQMQLRLHHGGVHILRHAVPEEDGEVHSQELVLPSSKKRAELAVQGQTNPAERNSPVSYQFQISGHQMFEQLQMVDRESSGNLLPADRGLISTSQHLEILQKDADGNLGISISDGQDFNLEAEQINLSDHDGSATVSLNSDLGRSLMRQVQTFANTNPSLESTGTFAEGRPLHHNLNEVQGDAGRKRKHVAEDVIEDYLLVKTDHSDLSKPDHLLSRWKYKGLSLLPEASVHHRPVTGSAGEEGTMGSQSLQDIAAQVSEFAASLPDSLAAGQLLTSQPQDTKAESNDLGPGLSVFSEMREQHASVTGLHPSHIGPSSTKSSRRILQSLVKSVPGRLSQHVATPLEPALLLASAQAAKSCETMMDAKTIQHQRTVKKSGCSVLGESHSAAKSATKPSVVCSDASAVKRKEFTCSFPDCNYVTTYVKDLQRHVRTHTGERPYTCPHCNKDFNRSDKLRVHIRWHTGDKPFKCPQCDYAAVDSSSLKKHVRTHTDERPFKCQICPYASRNSSQLIVHLRTHTGDSPFECEVCGSKFKINSDLKRHMRIHTGEKPYQCELCDYKCSIKGNLKSHYKINHSPENQLQCDQCSFSSSSQKLLRQHQKQHTTGQICPVCKYVCSTSSSLKNHLRTHSDERPFQCDFCPYSAKQRGNVKSHTKKRHADKLRSLRRYRSRGSSGHGSSSSRRSAASGAVKDSEGETEEVRTQQIRPSCPRTFHCLECKNSFVRADSLRSHMRLQHRRSLQTVGRIHGHSKHQEQQGHSPSHPSSVLQGEKSDGAQLQDPEMVFVPVSSRLTQQAENSRNLESHGHGALSSNPSSSPPRKRPRGQQGKSLGKKTLDQIADAASKLYQEQYDCKMESSKGRLPMVSQRAEQEVPQSLQFVEVLQSSPGPDLATSSPAGSCRDELGRSDSGIVYIDRETGAAREGLPVSCQVFVENVVLSESQDVVLSESPDVILSQAQQLLSPTSQVQKVVSHLLPSSSHLLCASSCPSTSSSATTLVTYVSSPPLTTSTGSHGTYLTSSPLQSIPQQQQQQAMGGSVVTYMIPVPAEKSQQPPQHSVSYISYITSPPEVPRSQQLQTLQQHPQQFQIPSPFSGQDVALVQQQSMQKSEVKFTTPVTFAVTSLPLSSRAQVPGCVVSIAGNPSVTVTSSSSPLVSTLQPVTSLSGAVSPRHQADLHTRQKYVKPAADLPPSVSLPLIISQGSAPNVMAVSQGPAPNVMAVSSSGQTSAISNSQISIGGLAAFQVASPVTGTQTSQSLRPSVQYQLQSSQPSAHLQPQELQTQPQMVLHPQPQLVLQDQQQHLQMQVIQHDILQHQQHLPQHTIPINIISPINIQQSQPPPLPPPPALQQQAQPTQIQIILPPTAFPQPITVSPGVGASAQPHIILQVQEQPAASHQPPSVPPPLPAPHVPAQQPAVAIHEANLAVMSNGRVLSLSPSIVQSILAQLQNGAGVSLSARDDGETQGLGSAPVHIQEVVIQVDPQQLGSAIMPKPEPNGSESNG